jgi:hypothetical protein
MSRERGNVKIAGQGMYGKSLEANSGMDELPVATMTRDEEGGFLRIKGASEVFETLKVHYLPQTGNRLREQP